jgi:hypothetical protein
LFCVAATVRESVRLAGVADIEPQSVVQNCHVSRAGRLLVTWHSATCSTANLMNMQSIRRGRRSKIWHTPVG